MINNWQLVLNLMVQSKTDPTALNKIQACLDKYPELLTETKPKQGSLLHLATTIGNVEVIKLLVEKYHIPIGKRLSSQSKDAIQSTGDTILTRLPKNKEGLEILKYAESMGLYLSSEADSFRTWGTLLSGLSLRDYDESAQAFTKEVLKRIPVDLWWKIPMNRNSESLMEYFADYDECGDGAMRWSGIYIHPTVFDAAEEIDPTFHGWLKERHDKINSLPMEEARIEFEVFSNKARARQWSELAERQRQVYPTQALDI